MKKIVVASQKGGPGKTTVARHLAFRGVDKGLRVVAIDLDVQGNFSDTFRTIAEEHGLDPAPAEGLVASALFDTANRRAPIKCTPDDALCFVPADPGIVVVERRELDDVVRAVQRRFVPLAKGYDVCVIDTGPSVSNLLVAALSVADYAVTPCKPDRDSLVGVSAFFNNVVRVREMGINPKLIALGVLPNLVNKGRAYHRDVLEQMRTAWGTSVLPVEVYERAAIDVAKGRPVWRTGRGESKSVAAQEMLTVCDYIYKRMGF